MATIAPPPRRAFDREETQRKVRHPLQTVRKYIRGYVLLEGAAIAILFLAAWFWAGLFIDYGTFRLLAFDWLQELRDVAPDSSNALFIRLLLLGVLFAILAALVITKVALRWLREFNDRAVALVLERRFPKELGDRLITAVELADPKQTTKFGYSEAMIEQTIHDAVQRIDRLPVASVFNWRRLVGWWVLVGLATLGILIVVTIFSLVIGLVIGDLASPLDLPFRMKDVGMIATERNLFLQNTYWPRRAYLEFARFQAKAESPNEMRVPREEHRPTLRVRAVEWVIADSTAADGWRALRWSDLPTLFTSTQDKALLDAVNIPEDFKHWIIDLDDLDASVPGGVLPASWQDSTADDVRKKAKDDLVQRNIEQANAGPAVNKLLDWKEWTVDRIALQMKKDPVVKNTPPVSVYLREIDAYSALEAVFDRLGDMADSPWMSRTLRRLSVPATVTVIARGESMVVSTPLEQPVDNKFAYDLNDLKESSRLRIRAEDYYTPAKRITLVAPPTVSKLTVDKEEPAYLYHRLQDGQQEPLRGEKHVFEGFTISLTGELSNVDVPYGTDLVLRAETDRKLRSGLQITVPVVHDAGSAVPTEAVRLGDDGKSFYLPCKNVTRTLDFTVEFSDEDNVRGKRHVRIKPIEDLPPKFDSDVGLGVALRKPRARAIDKTGPGGMPDAYLITPNAILPFVGTIRDDHGLTRVGWLFEADPIDVELSGLSKALKDKVPTGLLTGNRLSREQRAGWIASNFMFTPIRSTPGLMIPAHINGVRRIIEADPGRNSFSVSETFAMNDAFLADLERRAIEEISVSALKAKLRETPAAHKAWEFSLKYEGLPDDDYGRTAFEPRFSVNRNLKQLKDEINAGNGQVHYLLKLSVLATDNNVETGKPWTDSNGRTFWGNSSASKSPFRFLVVTETELLVQIALEEESLYERLDKAYDKLKNAKSIADDQITKLTSPAMKDEEMSLVGIRLDEVRKSVIDAGASTREISAAYKNILGELKVNRVRKDHVEKVHEKIVWPLERAVDPDDGNFVKCDKLFQDVYQDVDNDVNANHGAKNRPQHLKHLQTATRELDDLMRKLNSVLIALNLGMSEAKERERLVMIHRLEDQVRRSLTETETDIIRRLIEELNKKTP